MCMLPSEEAASFSSLALVSSREVAFLSNSDLASLSLANAASRSETFKTWLYYITRYTGWGRWP